MTPTIHRIGIREVVARTGLSAVTVWRRYREGRFPSPEYLDERRLWRVDAIESWEREQLARPPEARRRNRNLQRVEAAPS